LHESAAGCARRKIHTNHYAEETADFWHVVHATTPPHIPSRPLVRFYTTGIVDSKENGRMIRQALRSLRTLTIQKVSELILLFIWSAPATLTRAYVTL